MNDSIQRGITDIENLFKCVCIDFDDDIWRYNIPSSSGWYLIETNTPIEILKSIGTPQHKAHINIPKTIGSAVSLINLGAAIQQSGDDHYVVYNGEARNLKARAREHICGHGKTFCLGLAEYPILRKYSWRFCYAPASECGNLRDADKAVRVLFEQVWRAKHGWPILCKK